jgi:hypothetical protein
MSIEDIEILFERIRVLKGLMKMHKKHSDVWIELKAEYEQLSSKEIQCPCSPEQFIAWNRSSSIQFHIRSLKHITYKLRK